MRAENLIIFAKWIIKLLSIVGIEYYGDLDIAKARFKCES
jgi:hypothetical protein